MISKKTSKYRKLFLLSEVEKENKYLYRALRKEEIDAGNILIPKSIESFKSHPRLGIDTRLPFVLGEKEEYAVRQHQWKQSGFPTSGISATPYFERAKVYARQGVIVKIDRELLSKFGIKEYIVKDWLKKFPEDISVPEDEEVILVKEECKMLPKEIIIEVIKVWNESNK
jgi:hypothetical protein